MADMEECPRCQRQYQVGPQCPCWMDDSDTEWECGPTAGPEPAAEPGSEPGSEPAAEPGSEPAAEPGSEPGPGTPSQPGAEAQGGDDPVDRPPLLREWADDPYVASRRARTLSGRRTVHEILATRAAALLRANEGLLALAEEEAQLEQKRKRMEKAEESLKQRKRVATRELRSALQHSTEILALAEATF